MTCAKKNQLLLEDNSINELTVELLKSKGFALVTQTIKYYFKYCITFFFNSFILEMVQCC